MKWIVLCLALHNISAHAQTPVNPAFEEMPLQSVKPAGWLKHQLTIMGKIPPRTLMKYTTGSQLITDGSGEPVTEEKKHPTGLTARYRTSWNRQFFLP